MCVKWWWWWWWAKAWCRGRTGNACADGGALRTHWERYTGNSPLCSCLCVFIRLLLISSSSVLLFRRGNRWARESANDLKRVCWKCHVSHLFCFFFHTSPDLFWTDWRGVMCCDIAQHYETDRNEMSQHFTSLWDDHSGILCIVLSQQPWREKGLHTHISLDNQRAACTMAVHWVFFYLMCCTSKFCFFVSNRLC